MGLFDELLGRKEPNVEQRSQTISISDPTLAAFFVDFGYGSGLIDVSETRALGNPGYFRAVNVVAGTIAGLPLKTYSDIGESRKRVKSFLDNPAGPYPLTPFAWKELVMLNLINQGEVFLQHIYNEAGAIIGLWPVHRGAVSKVELVGYEKRFTVSMADGTTHEYDTYDMTQIMGMTLDGIRGIAPITLFRNTFKLGTAGELAALKSFTKGLMISGLVTPRDEDIDPEDAKKIKTDLEAKLSGLDNAGDIAVINKALTFSPWQMNNADAQFLESREFQIVEFCRMLGVPPHLVGSTEKQTSWGTGVAEQNLGLQKYTLQGWTSRVEEALSDLLPKPRFCEFEFKALLQGTPAQEIALLIKQVEAGLLTKDEARAIMNLPPLPKDAVKDGDPSVE